MQRASEDELTEAVRDAAEVIRAETGRTAWTWFEEGEGDHRSSSSLAHGVGLIEGAALALGSTPLELLDELGFAADEP